MPLWQAWSISVYFVCLSRLSVSTFLYAYCLYTVCTYGHMHKHRHSLSTQLILKIFGSYNKDTANSESSNPEQFFLTKGNTELGSCAPLGTIFSSPINIKHIVYFCLKTPYLIYHQFIKIELVANNTVSHVWDITRTITTFLHSGTLDNTSDYAWNHFKNEIIDKKTKSMALNIYTCILTDSIIETRRQRIILLHFSWECVPQVTWIFCWSVSVLAWPWMYCEYWFGGLQRNFSK